MASKISGVAEEVRAEMGRHRMNQRALATLLDISESTASRRVRGLEPFTLPELFTLAEHFDVPITDLFGGRDESPGAMGSAREPVLAGQGW